MEILKRNSSKQKPISSRHTEKLTFFKQLALAVLILCLKAASALGQPLENKIFHEKFYTVSLNVEGVPIGYPAMELNAPGNLVLRFDELGDINSDLSYKIIHCNADWTASTLRPQEYFNGFWKEAISTYDYSFNTVVPFTHYTVKFPRQGQKFTRSGNYVIQIFRTADENDIVFQARFMIYETLVNLDVRVKQPDRMFLRDAYQEVDVYAYHKFPFNNASNETSIQILQNGKWHGASKLLKPRFVKNGELDFNYDTANVFPGGNEYRFFDIRDLSFNGPRVYLMDKDKTPIYAQLYRDIDRYPENYTQMDDLNGGFLVQNRLGIDHHYDSDYLQVLFSIKAPYAQNEREIFVDGGWILGGLDQRFKLKYNKSLQQYQCLAMVKQGFYNYRYISKEDNKATEPFMEGSFWQTENEYQVIFYYMGVTDETHRIIGYQVVNSIRP